ncbi:MAG: hypothetical protein JNM56_12915 [Planctomycetia bacterium]|nr:hypothetical protein [Planctomycetia bacterium]
MMKSPLALLAGAMLLAPPLRAENWPQPDAAQVRQFIRQLDDARFPARQEADRRLRDLGIGVVPILRQELAARPPLEVSRRLESIVEELAQVRWRQDVKQALKESRQTGKPLLVLSSLGRGDGSGSLATQVMVSRTLGDLKLIHFINQHFVPVWHQQLDDTQLDEELLPKVAGFAPEYTAEQVRTYEEGRGHRNLRTFFCTPDGKVYRRLEGFADASGYLSNIKDAHELLRGTAGLSERQRIARLQGVLTLRGEEVTRARQGLAGREALLAEQQARLLFDSASQQEQRIEALLEAVRQELVYMTFT